MSYGTARDLDDVERYYTHIRHGSPPAAELLAQLKSRYEAIGGASPLIEITEKQVRGLQGELERRGFDVKTYNGMKHTAPFLEDAVAQMAADGVERGIGLVLAPHYSRFSVGEYVERARKAAEPAGLEIDFVEGWHDRPGFIALLAQRVRDAIMMLGPEKWEATPVVFSAHSLPKRILDSGDPYADELEETAALVSKELGLTDYRTAWQSAGRTGEEWLGPDILDVLREIGEGGAPACIVCSCGFVSDHLEVLYDIDIEAQEVAHSYEMTLVRTESPNADRAFLQLLADIVQERM
jgi:ferrochelatase